jgi:hypothetical protein
VLHNLTIKFRDFMLYTILYTCSANKPFVEDDLAELAIQSSNWNITHSITGCLAYVEGVLDCKTQSRFIHVLEGPEIYIKGIFDKISLDMRYKNISLIKEGRIEKRKFNAWKMCVERINLNNDLAFQHFFTMNCEILSEEGSICNNILMDFMETFYDQRQSIECECMIGAAGLVQ